MAVSGSTAYTMTAANMVKNALVELGVLASGTSPTTAEETDGLTRLNSMLKSWQMQGVSLWREDDRSVTITAATTPTTLSVEVRQVFSARFVDSDSNERMLGQWEREDYLSLPDKTTEGDPTIFYVARERDALKLYVWPVPTANSTVKIDCERIVYTVTASSEDVDVPQHAFEAVWVNLAVRMAPMFGVMGDRLAEIRERAGRLYAALLDDDRPQSIFIGAY